MWLTCLIWLVVWNHGILLIVIYIYGNFIIPIFFRGVGEKPPTSYGFPKFPIHLGSSFYPN